MTGWYCRGAELEVVVSMQPMAPDDLARISASDAAAQKLMQDVALCCERPLQSPCCQLQVGSPSCRSAHRAQGAVQGAACWQHGQEDVIWQRALTVLRRTQAIAMTPMGRYQPPSENGPWQNSRPL